MREREGEREKSNQTRSDQINTSNSRQDPSYFAKRHYCIRRLDNPYRLAMRNIHEPSFPSRRIPPTGVKWLVSNKYQSCQCRSLYSSTYLPTYLSTYQGTSRFSRPMVHLLACPLVRLFVHPADQLHPRRKDAGKRAVESIDEQGGLDTCYMYFFGDASCMVCRDDCETWHDTAREER